MPHVLQGLGCLLSGALWPLHYSVASFPNITCCLRFPWQDGRFYCTWWRRTTAADKAGSTRLNAWQLFLFPLVLLSAEALSSRHGNMPFPKTLPDVMTNTTQQDRGVNLWRDSWPVRNRRWERADSLVHSISSPTIAACERMFHVACQDMAHSHASCEAVPVPRCFCFLASLSHLLVSLIHSYSHWLHSFQVKLLRFNL